MPTECSADLFGFAAVEGREVVAGFDGGAITSNAGALLLGSTDRAIGLLARFATCFEDVRRQDLIEHEVVTLVGQRVFGIALGYEDLNDHDRLRHDPIFAVLAGKLAARREDCAPLAGKSTLNRLELSRLQPTRYHKISHNPIAIKRLFVDLFLEAHERAPDTIVLDLDATCTCDCSRRAAPRYLVGSSPRLTRSTATERLRVECPAIHHDEFHVAPPNARNTMCPGPLIARLKFEA
jgi:Transposase DDE domain group 1